MRSKICFTLVMILALSIGAFAQNKKQASTDYQFRLVNHLQVIGKDKKLGFGGWWVFPDMTARKDHFKSLVIGGLLYKNNKHWVEFMGGTLIHQNGDKDPLINIRASEKRFQYINLFGDFEYFLKKKNRRFYSFISADTPANFGKLKTSIGVESENIIFNNKSDVYGIGPSLAIPLAKKVTFKTAYQFNTKQNFFRNYLIFNF